MTYALYIVGEHIPDGSVVLGAADNKLYRAGTTYGVLVGNAVEQLREGFRAQVHENGEVREDDA